MDAPGNRQAVTAAELDHALRLLDNELTGLRLEEPLQIRAIGGYALLKHGVREGKHALTVDIDTMTRDYSAAVQQAIRTVADKTGLDRDWLNNDNLGGNDPERIEAMYDAQWQGQSLGLDNIDVSLATVPTLTRAKIIAADTAAESGRGQDAPDLIALLKHQKITSADQFSRAYPDPFEEYPNAQELVQSHFRELRKARIQAMKDVTARRAADLDWGDGGRDDQYQS